VFDGLHDAVIDTDTYNKVQEVLNSRRKTPINSNLPMQNPFAGVLVCSVCGKPLKRRPIDKRRPGHSASYDCLTRGCPTVGCPVGIVEARVLAGIKEYLGNYKLELKDSTPLQPPIYNNTRIATYNKKLEDLQLQLGRTFTLLEQGIYDKDTFFSRQKTIKEEMTDILNIIAKLENEDKQTKMRAEYNATLIPQLENLIEVWDALPDAKAKNDLIKTLFHQIRYSKTTKGNRWNKDLVDDFEIEFVSKLPDN